MRNFAGAGWISICALLLVTGCATGSQESADSGDTADEEMAAAMPDTTAESLWAHLEAEAYQSNWSLWPGKGELYTGQEPHGMLLTSYMNAIAVTAYRAEETPFPEGSIIVKENYTPEKELAAVTVMMKSSGYNPDGGDWFWLKRLADGTVAVQGRGAGCIACHQASTEDWIRTPRVVAEDAGDSE
jgi:hypothetical protein